MNNNCCRSIKKIEILKMKISHIITRTNKKGGVNHLKLYVRVIFSINHILLHVTIEGTF